MDSICLRLELQTLPLEFPKSISVATAFSFQTERNVISLCTTIKEWQAMVIMKSSYLVLLYFETCKYI